MFPDFHNVAYLNDARANCARLVFGPFFEAFLIPPALHSAGGADWRPPVRNVAWSGDQATTREARPQHTNCKSQSGILDGWRCPMAKATAPNRKTPKPHHAKAVGSEKNASSPRAIMALGTLRRPINRIGARSRDQAARFAARTCPRARDRAPRNPALAP